MITAIISLPSYQISEKFTRAGDLRQEKVARVRALEKELHWRGLKGCRIQKEGLRYVCCSHPGGGIVCYRAQEPAEPGQSKTVDWMQFSVDSYRNLCFDAKVLYTTLQQYGNLKCVQEDLRMKVKNLKKYLLAVGVLAFAVMTAPASLVRAAETQGTYTVERGDNLSKIAKKVYGKETLWREIYKANAGTVKDDYIIYKGQVLAIPAANGSSAAAPVTPAPAAPVPAPETTPVSEAATPVPAPETPAPATPAPAPETSAPSAPAEAQEYTLDYNAIASWVDGGFIGNDGSGAPVVMALDAANDYAIIIFGDNSDMTAVSFAGPITYTDDTATITDETTGLALTFGVAEVNDSTLALSMGDLGSATITAAAKEDVLATIKIAVENYRHLA